MPDAAAGDDPIHEYRQLAATAADTLGLDATVKLVLSQDWGMEPDPGTGSEPGTMTVYCPPYRETAEHVLLHYLVHGTMLEAGWQQPLLRVGDADDTVFLIANRSADAFTDFWAYRLVHDTFGADHLQQYTAWIVDTDVSRLVQNLIETREQHGFTDSQFSRYCAAFALDWFATAPAILQPVHPDRATHLLDRYTELQQTAFTEHGPHDLADRLAAVRAHYRELQQEHASYRDLLGEAQETAFSTYYDAAWPNQPPAALAGFTSLIERDGDTAQY